MSAGRRDQGCSDEPGNVHDASVASMTDRMTVGRPLAMCCTCECLVQGLRALQCCRVDLGYAAVSKGRVWHRHQLGAMDVGGRHGGQLRRTVSTMFWDTSYR